MRAVIAEDSVLLRVGLVKVLEAAGYRSRRPRSATPRRCWRGARSAPELVVVGRPDAAAHTDEGVRAALVIRRQWPEVAVLLLSQYVEERYAADLLSTNTSGVGYLLKERVADVRRLRGRPAAGWRGAARRWTRRWSPNCWCAATATRWSG